jgi:hypothetical protein
MATPVVTAPQKWEYKFLHVEVEEVSLRARLDAYEVSKQLNLCGEEGWELVAA